MNNLSPAELKAMADTLLAADDEKQAKAKTKAAPAADKTAEDKPGAEKPEAEKTTEEKLNELIEARQKGRKALEQGSHGARGHEPLERGDREVLRPARES